MSIMLPLQRVKVFHEREVKIFNQKIRELNDLTKSKEAEIHVSSRILSANRFNIIILLYSSITF